MSNSVWIALAVVMLIEGLLPLVNPGAWRRVFEQALSLSDGQLRFIGLISVTLGLVLLWLLQ